MPHVTRVNYPALGLLLFFAGYLTLATQIPNDPWSLPGDFSASAFPYLCGGLGFIAASLMLFNQGIRPAALDPQKPFELPKFNDPILTMLVILVIYITLIDVLGFVLASILFLIIGARKTGPVAWQRLLPFAVGVPLLLWGLLDLMNIYLSPGRLLMAWLNTP